MSIDNDNIPQHSLVQFLHVFDGSSHSVVDESDSLRPDLVLLEGQLNGRLHDLSLDVESTVLKYEVKGDNARPVLKVSLKDYNESCGARLAQW